MTLVIVLIYAHILNLAQIGPDVYGYDFVCPDKAQWGIYSKAVCDPATNFACLKDVIENKYRYDCYRSRPVGEGYKYVFRPGFDREKCDPSRYQPFLFQRYQQSDCAYLKSKCKEEGQVLHSERTSEFDVSCKCDEENGFAFVISPKNKDFCIPTEEDCSCYLKSNTTITHTNNGQYNATDKNSSIILIDDLINGIQTERFTQLDDTKYNIHGIWPNRRFGALSVTLVLLACFVIHFLIFWKWKKYKKLCRRIGKRFLVVPPLETKVESPNKTNVSTVAGFSSKHPKHVLKPFEKLVLKEFFCQLSPEEAVGFAKTLMSKHIIDKEGYSEIENCYKNERNYHLRVLTVDKIIKNCSQLSNLIFVLYYESDQCKQWARALYMIYESSKTQMPVAVQRASVGNRQKIHDKFIEYKSFLQTLHFEDPERFLAEIAEKILLKIQDDSSPKRGKLCDQYVVFAALVIDSMANKTNAKEIEFAKIMEVIPYTTCPALSNCMLYGRQAVALSFLREREKGEEVVMKALYEETFVLQCLETIDLYYKIVLYYRAWFEDEPEAITEKIKNLSTKASLILQSKQDDIRLFWSRRFIVRLLYCYLGLGMRGRFIPGFKCSEENIKQSEYLLSCYDSEDAELRIQMFFNITKARLFHLTGNRPEMLDFIDKAEKIAKNGGFTAELRAIEEAKLLVQNETH